MNLPLANRFGPSLVLLATALLGAGCGETRTPTEPAKVVSPTPIPSPAPTPIPQPAEMSGSITFPYGDPKGGVENVIVVCQGRSTIMSSTGAFSLSGLMSGSTIVTVTVNLSPLDSLDYAIELKPGANVVNLQYY